MTSSKGDGPLCVYFSSKRLPIAAYMVAVLTKQSQAINFTCDDNFPLPSARVLTKDKSEIQGNITVAFYLAKKYGMGLTNDSTVFEWFEFASHEFMTDKDTDIDKPIQYLNHLLQIKTYLCGNRLTLSDLAVLEVLKNKKSVKGYIARFGKHVPDFTRWYNYMDNFVTGKISVLQQAAKKKGSTLAANSENADAKKKSSSSSSSSSVDNASELTLPNAEMGKVVTRFPPEASGYLHIGHAKAALLNSYFAKRYNGRLVIRFDDTNPSKEKTEYEEAILKDLKSIGIDFKTHSYTSDYFPQLLDYAEQLLKSGKAFIDDTDVDRMREEKLNCIESRNRNNSIEKNLQMWEEMKNGTEQGLKCVCRAKLNMKSENGALRDPVMYRCKPEPHARTGNKYKIYPTYDFSCPVVDSLEGVTHALRTSEYNDRNDQYYWFIDALGLRKPFLWDYSRMNFEYTVMSKRKLQMLVNMSVVDGWDDPRFPTVQGLIRHGLTIEALTKFVLDQGASRSVATLQWEKLWSINKQIIDPVIPRFTALEERDLAVFEIEDGPQKVETKVVPKHKKNSSLGTKTICHLNRIYLASDDAKAIKENEEVTLMDWGNAIIKTIQKSDEKVTSMNGVLNLKGSVKKTEKKLTWLAVTDELVRVKLAYFDPILSKAKLEENDQFSNFVNMNSKHESWSLGDPNLKQLKKGDLLQLERRGYFICDEPYDDNKKYLTLFNIPDGKSIIKK